MGRKRHPDRAMAIELAREHGWTPTETAQTFGLYRGTVSRWFAEDGLQAPPRPGERPKPERRRRYAQIRRLRSKGLSLREVARRTGYSYAMVRKVLSKC